MQSRQHKAILLHVSSNYDLCSCLVVCLFYSTAVTDFEKSRQLLAVLWTVSLKVNLNSMHNAVTSQGSLLCQNWSISKYIKAIREAIGGRHLNVVFFQKGGGAGGCLSLSPNWSKMVRYGPKLSERVWNGPKIV